MTLRIQTAEIPAELRKSFIKQLGTVAEPLEVLWNYPRLAEANQELTAKAAGFDACDASLKTFAHMAVAAQIGCSWCLDINYFLAQHQGLDLAKASQVPLWRQSEVFSPLETRCAGVRGGHDEYATYRQQRALCRSAGSAWPGGDG